MTTVYASISEKDHSVREIVNKQLHEMQYSPLPPITYDRNNLNSSLMGIKPRLDQADVMIIIFSKNYISEPLLGNTESGVILNYSNIHKKLVIPIIIDDSIPSARFLSIPYFRTSLTDLPEIIKKLDALIIDHKVRIDEEIKQEQQKAEKKEVVQRVKDSQELVQVIEGLKHRETKNKQAAFWFYLLGIAFLIGGLGMAYLSVVNVPNDKNIYYYGFVAIKNLVILGLLIACAKYTFHLGKVYMNEGTKQHDRLHAIHYGKFFLESFQDKLSYDEMKEVFKDWNIDNNKEGNKVLNDADPLKVDTKITGEIIDQFGKLSEQIAKLKK